MTKKRPDLFRLAFREVVYIMTYDATHPKAGEGSDRSMLVHRLYKKLLKIAK